MTITNVLLGVLLLCAHNAASISAPNCTVQAAAGKFITTVNAGYVHHQYYSKKLQTGAC